MRAKECLSCDRFMPSATDCSHSEPSVSHVATGPIVLRREPNPHHPKRASYRLEDEAMLRIRCWKGGSVQTTEVQGPRLDHRSTSPQYGSGRVAALTSYSQVRCGSGRCIGHRPRLREGPAMHRSQNRQAFKTRMGGVDAAFPPVLSPGFEPGLDASLAHCLYRLGYESMRRQSAGICPRSPLWIRPLVSDPCTHACGGRAYCNTRHDRDHGG